MTSSTRTSVGTIVPNDRPRIVHPAGVWRLADHTRLALQSTVAAGPSGRTVYAAATTLAEYARLERDGLVERRGPIGETVTYVATLAGTQATRRCIMAQDLRKGDALAGHAVTMVTDYGTYVAINLGAEGIRYLDHGWPTFPTTIADHGANLPF